MDQNRGGGRCSGRRGGRGPGRGRGSEAAARGVAERQAEFGERRRTQGCSAPPGRAGAAGKEQVARLDFPPRTHTEGAAGAALWREHGTVDLRRDTKVDFFLLLCIVFRILVFVLFFETGRTVNYLFILLCFLNFIFGYHGDCREVAVFAVARVTRRCGRDPGGGGSGPVPPREAGRAGAKQRGSKRTSPPLGSRGTTPRPSAGAAALLCLPWPRGGGSPGLSVPCSLQRSP